MKLEIGKFYLMKYTKYENDTYRKFTIYIGVASERIVLRKGSKYYYTSLRWNQTMVDKILKGAYDNRGEGSVEEIPFSEYSKHINYHELFAWLFTGEPTS